MNIDINKLNLIDLTELSTSINEKSFADYFNDVPGLEHYKLLAYFSTLYSNQTLLDIGTYKGCSALALAYNKKNKVVSFDVITDSVGLNNIPNNIEFKVDNILNDTYIDLILNSPFIILDTAHEGPFEHEFYNHLISINYKGVLMLDDIKLNDAMIEFWNSISNEKYDVSNIGHHSGTGLVIFK